MICLGSCYHDREREDLGMDTFGRCIVRHAAAVRPFGRCATLQAHIVTAWSSNRRFGT
jgi:hypothetical protein